MKTTQVKPSSLKIDNMAEELGLDTKNYFAVSFAKTSTNMAYVVPKWKTHN